MRHVGRGQGMGMGARRHAQAPTTVNLHRTDCPHGTRHSHKTSTLHISVCRCSMEVVCCIVQLNLDTQLPARHVNPHTCALTHTSACRHVNPHPQLVVYFLI